MGWRQEGEAERQKQMRRLLLLSPAFRTPLSGRIVTRYGIQQGILMNKVWSQPCPHSFSFWRSVSNFDSNRKGVRKKPTYTHTHTRAGEGSCFLYIMYLKISHTATKNLHSLINPICQRPSAHSLQLRRALDNSTLIHTLFICTDKIICRPAKPQSVTQHYKNESV